MAGFVVDGLGVEVGKGSQCPDSISRSVGRSSQMTIDLQWSPCGEQALPVGLGGSIVGPSLVEVAVGSGSQCPDFVSWNDHCNIWVEVDSQWSPCGEQALPVGLGGKVGGASSVAVAVGNGSQCPSPVSKLKGTSIPCAATLTMITMRRTSTPSRARRQSRPSGRHSRTRSGCRNLGSDTEPSLRQSIRIINAIAREDSAVFCGYDRCPNPDTSAGKWNARC